MSRTMRMAFTASFPYFVSKNSLTDCDEWDRTRIKIRRLVDNESSELKLMSITTGRHNFVLILEGCDDSRRYPHSWELAKDRLMNPLDSVNAEYNEKGLKKASALIQGVTGPMITMALKYVLY
jgi:hypothetical protein